MLVLTVNLLERSQTLLVDHIDLLRGAFDKTQTDYPFEIEAIVILPDHLHAIWTLPPNDADFSTRWRLIMNQIFKSIAKARAAIRDPQEAKRAWHLAAAILGTHDPKRCGLRAARRILLLQPG